ncbi:MAG: CocE/NonD family hydrolase [Nevskiales bacterium]|nr:CocE/NonD family hydrolase [Nevskiales bacterium]
MPFVRFCKPAATLALALLLHACGSSSTPDAGTTTPDRSFVDIECDSPAPAEARQYQFTSPLPQDLDPLVDPLPTTELYFTVMLPERCAGEVFPVVLQSHGYGGSRRRELAADGTLYPQHAGLTAVDEMTTALAYHDYVVVSVDQRGHGESQPRNGGGYVRLNSPDVETRDLQTLLDWLYDHAGDLQIWRQDDSGTPKDIKVGTLGYSYGGAAQFALAALDQRVDAIVPIATWHNLLYSLAAGEAIKQNWIQLLCLFAVVPSDGAVIGAINTPAIETMCNSAGARNAGAYGVRTYDDLIARISAASAYPRPVAESEFRGLLDQGMHWFKTRQDAGQPWGYGERRARLRPVPALILQGNRDGIFNLTGGYLNWRYFKAAGGDARLLSMESGHLSPFVGQVDGTGNCGSVQGVYAILGWYDHYLKGLPSADYDALPDICVSVQSSVNAPAGAEVGVALERMPVGSLSGAGSLPTVADTVAVDIPALGDGRPVFVPLTTIPDDGYVLAGVPTVGSVTVAAGAGATHAAIGLIGVGLRRDGELYLIDDQVTGFVEGTHRTNGFIDEGDPVLLPALGEILQQGDEIGLMFYEQQVQYQILFSASSLTTLLPGSLVSYIAGRPFPDPLSDTLTPVVNNLTNFNPYSAELRDVRLPILRPGIYPHSAWRVADPSS